MRNSGKRPVWFLLALALCVGLAGCGGTSGGGTPEPAESEPESEPVEIPTVTAAGTQSVVMEGFDWGPAITKTVLALNTQVAAGSVTAGSFAVAEKKEAFDYAAYAAWSASDDETDPPPHTTADAVRTVTNAYVCDEAGNRVAGDSEYVALELAYSPDSGNPYCFDLMTWHNTPCDPYELSITLTAENTLRTPDGSIISALDVKAPIDLSKAAMPQLEQVDMDGVFTGADGRTLCFGAYEPEDDGEKHPLVIWLHGAGEGGEDPSILWLGNKVTGLLSDEFQTAMGGAYILTPQTPDFWLTYNDAGDWQDNPGVSSVYNATLMALIQSYVSNTPQIDQDRIYIGGCSNGGYMTMDMILTHPNYFAAAYPICEAYRDSGITDAQLSRIRNLPVWFVYAEDDDTVVPENFEIPTVERLQAIGADVHTSVFPHVVDTSGLYKNTDGTPYQYAGHWSWLYFFNGECEEDGVNLWDWMAAQSK